MPGSRPSKPDLSLLRKLYIGFPTSLPTTTPTLTTVTQKSRKSDTIYCFIFWNTNLLILKDKEKYTVPNDTIKKDNTDAHAFIKKYINETYIQNANVIKDIQPLKNEAKKAYYYVKYSGPDAYTYTQYPIFSDEKSNDVCWLPLIRIKDTRDKFDDLNPLLEAMKRAGLDTDLDLDIESLRRLPKWASGIFDEKDIPETCGRDCIEKQIQTDIYIGDDFSNKHILLESDELREYQKRLSEIADLTGDPNDYKAKQRRFAADYPHRILHVAGKDELKSLTILNPYAAASYREDAATSFTAESTSKYDASGIMKSRNLDVIHELIPESIIVDKPMTVSILESLWFCGQNQASIKNDPRCFPTRLLGELREYQAFKQSPTVKMVKNWPVMKYFVGKLKYMIPGAKVPLFDMKLLPMLSQEEEPAGQPSVQPAVQPGQPSVQPVQPAGQPGQPSGQPVQPVQPPVQQPVQPANKPSAPFPPVRRTVARMTTGVLVPRQVGAIGLRPILPSRQLGVLPGLLSNSVR